MQKQYDIERLSKAVFNIEKIYELIRAMDENEYNRFRAYMYSRHEVSFPFVYPKS